ncbi:MAG: hypothetical protein PVH61_30080 [Candidatus Aminicenantes bacterium]|jgi:hypothetical protein
MIEQVQGYIVPTAGFLLLLLGAVSLVEKYKNIIPLKVSPDTLTNIFSTWCFIICFRKMIYYVPFFGIMQTESTLWRVDANVLIFIYYIFILFLLGVAVIVYIALRTKSVTYEGLAGLILAVFFLGASLILPISKGLNISLAFDKGLLLIIFAPLLVLKMLCSGKYLGILTAFLLGIFINNRYNKLKPKITRRNVKFLKLPLFMLLAFGIFSFIHFPGSPGEKFMSKVQAARSPLAVEDLLAAAHSIKTNEDYWMYALKTISGKIVDIGDIQWKREMFLRVTAAVKKLTAVKERYELIKEIAVDIAKTGDIQWAESLAESIPYKDIKTSARQEIREKEEKK